jgi:pimeloyl-ACP methyl ester carboxylesterase
MRASRNTVVSVGGRLARDARGVAALAVDGVLGVTDIVERVHATIASATAPVGEPHLEPARGISGFVYRSVRGITRGVGWSLQRALVPFARDGEVDSPRREHVIAALNGVLGDRLAASDNPLAITMAIRLDEPGEAPPLRIALFLHGLCMHDRHWPRGEGSAHAAVRALGYTPLYLRYNTGRGVAENGQELSARLDALLAAWTVQPTELAMVGHSMGGLVARSACEHARRTGARWLPTLRHMVFLGTPHQGSALERAGKRVDYLLGISPYTAPFVALGGVRSAGIQGLGDGRVSEDGEPVALPTRVRCHAVAGRQGRNGDGLVSVDSALGRRSLGLARKDTLVIEGAGHIELMHHPDGVAAIARWLRPKKQK